MTRNLFLRSIFATLALLTLFAAAPARADRCDDLAAQLKNQIDGMRVGRTAANLIYSAHPNAREITLGCSGRSFSNQLFAKADRKPKPAFIDLIASAAAIVFTLAERLHADGRDPLHEADGPVSRRRRLDPLPPPRHALHQDQDRGHDHDLAAAWTNRRGVGLSANS